MNTIIALQLGLMHPAQSTVLWSGFAGNLAAGGYQPTSIELAAKYQQRVNQRNRNCLAATIGSWGELKR